MESTLYLKSNLEIPTKICPTQFGASTASCMNQSFVSLFSYTGYGYNKHMQLIIAGDKGQSGLTTCKLPIVWLNKALVCYHAVSHRFIKVNISLIVRF